METVFEYILRILFLFAATFTVGTLMLFVFVRVCLMAGLLAREDRGTMREFLRNFD